MLRDEGLFYTFLQIKYLASNGNSLEIVENELLEGHLGITKELLAYHSVQERFTIGTEEGGNKLLEVNAS